jgi:arylsulfatase A-like enzyme
VAVLVILAGVGLIRCSGPERPKSLLVITIDTTRADHLGAYGYTAARTPTIDLLAAEGTLYERAYSVTAETLPSHSSIFSGLYPPSHAVRLNLSFKLSDEVTTLAEVLQGSGYFTAAITAASVLEGRFGLDQGFDIYEGPEIDERRPGRLTEFSAEVVTTKVLGLANEHRDERFFLWAHYYDPHSPFEPRYPFEAPEGAQPESVELYDLEIAYTDYWIGRLLEGLEAHVGLDDTLVVFTADHGESLGDHGESYHTLFIYDSTVHVPLILSGPGIPRGQRVTEVVSSVDLFATVLALLGVEAPASNSRLLPGLPVSPESAAADRVAYSDSMTPPLRYGWHSLEAVRTGDWLYIRAPDQELYRFDGRDPGQAVNLFQVEEDAAAQMQETLAATKGAMPSVVDDQMAERSTSEAERQALEALGYIEGGAANAPAEESGALDPKDMVEVEEAIQLARLASHMGRLGTAEELLSWATTADPENFTVWMQLGKTRLAAGDLEGSLEALYRSLEIQPDSWEIQVQVAAAEERRGNLGAAEAMLDRALATSPFPVEVWRTLVNLRLQRGDREAAAEALREILDLEPENQRARKTLEAMIAGNVERAP